MAQQTPDYQWVDTPKAMTAALDCLQHCTVVAIDTEFVREQTFYPQLGLVQLACDQGVFLVDPLCIDMHCAQALALKQRWQTLLTAPHILKVLHAGGEDIETLHHWLQVVPSPVLDSQWAALMLGERPSIGYADLVQAWLQCPLDKGCTRSNWLARPLTAQQLQYALYDVTYLLQLAHLAVQRLSQQQRLEWALQDCAHLAQQALPLAEDQYYQRFNAQRLSISSQHLLYALSRWREQQARQQNRPRRQIMADDLLLAIARNQPSQAEALYRLASTDRDKRCLLTWAEAVLEQIVQVQQTAEQHRLLPLLDGPLTPAQREQLARLKQQIKQLSTELALPEAALANTRQLQALLQAHQQQRDWPQWFSGWRAQQVTPALIQQLDDDTPP